MLYVPENVQFIEQKVTTCFVGRCYRLYNKLKENFFLIYIYLPNIFVVA
jgi:hypothetical protein